MAERGLFAGREVELIGYLTLLHSQLAALTQVRTETVLNEYAPPELAVSWTPPPAAPKEKPIIFTKPSGQRRSLGAIRRSDDYNLADHLQGGYVGTSDKPPGGARPARIPTSLVTEFNQGAQDIGEVEWRFVAVCAQTDPEIFFSARNQALIEQAKKVCGSCAVRIECANYAIESDETDGVWGGMDQEQLQQEARRRRQPDYRPAADSAPVLRLENTESEPAA